MDLLTGATSRLPVKLLEMLKEEYKLQKGVKVQVKALSKEVGIMHTALCKVAQVPREKRDPQVREWADEVREASYDMEDIVDTFLIRVDGKPPQCADPATTTTMKRFFKRMGKLFCLSKMKSRHEIASEIGRITARLEKLTELRERYKVNNVRVAPDQPERLHQCATPETGSRLSALNAKPSLLLGIEEQRDALVKMLSESGSHNKKKIVSIVGFGGLGKTTLANAVYEKLKVDGRFRYTAFVPVGRKPDLKKILSDIIIQCLDKKRYSKEFQCLQALDEYQLIDELQEILKDKRYLFVIDDIWDEKPWRTINPAFHENNTGSRIIITSRNIDVAEAVGKDYNEEVISEVYKLQPLSYDNSKRLFYKRIFGDHYLNKTRIFGGEGKYLDSQSNEIADKFLKKCGGVPLAIITMASLLARKAKAEWPKLYESISLGNDEDEYIHNIKEILSFSYYDLPHHLKSCLLYLSVYPEDYIIDKDQLIWKWVAEGFVDEKPGIGLFEAGENYFFDLINRSMIQVVVSDIDGAVSGCLVHDMILDFIRSLSRNENFVTILDGVGSISQQCIVRRLAQHISVGHMTHINADNIDMSHVRSYIVVRCDTSQWVRLSSFTLLRVLNIEDCQQDEGSHLENLGNLLHLRYLGLRGTFIRDLPAQIENLKFLQTLDMTRSWIRGLPASVMQLTQLMCLCSDYRGMAVPDGLLGNLTSLQELRIQPRIQEKAEMRRFVMDLGSLKELRVLDTSFDVMDDDMQRDLVESLRNFHKIRHLALFFEYLIDADMGMWEAEAEGFVLPFYLRHLSLLFIRFSWLPSCINLCSLSRLSYLALNVAGLDEQDLELIGSLPELGYLYLQTESTVTMANICSSAGRPLYFKKLRWLKMPLAMVQFEPSADGSGISFRIRSTWSSYLEDSSHALRIWRGSRKFECTNDDSSYTRSDSSNLSYVAMPELEVLDVAVFMGDLLDSNFDYCDNIGLDYLPSLQEVHMGVFCGNASAEEVDQVEVALCDAIDYHPNWPRRDVYRHDGFHLIQEEDYSECTNPSQPVSPLADD